MEEINFLISDEQFSKLNEDYPEVKGNRSIEKRAVEIVKLYFLSIYDNSYFDVGRDGSDLIITSNNETFEVEVKGTKSPDLAWSKIKISSKRCYKKIKNGMPIYRVVNVFDREVKIYILKYPDDFNMDKEERWAVKKNTEV